jgi:HEAT repeat protein
LTSTERYRARILDEKEEPGVRIRDLGSLHQLGGVTPEVAEGMLRLLERTQDDRQQAQILLGLEGVKTAEVRSEMLIRLKGDVSPRVRRAAASALHPLREEPEVRGALEFARTNDPDPDVRRAGDNSLTRAPLPPPWTVRKKG